MSQLEALLFDVDGTLADTERDGHREAFNRAFEQANLDWHWDVELYGKLLKVTGGKERIKYYLNEFNTEYKKPWDLDGFVGKLHASKTKHFTNMLAMGDIPLRPGVERILREARETGMRMGISTTTTPANVEALITHTLGADAMGWFEVIAAGDIVPAKKPAPDIYTYAMEQMGLQPNQCLAFEDSLNGIKSSTAAGLKTVITINGYTANDDFSDALIVLDNFGEPDSPFKTLQGSASKNYFDLALAKELFAQG